MDGLFSERPLSKHSRLAQNLAALESDPDHTLSLAEWEDSQHAYDPEGYGDVQPATEPQRCIAPDAALAVMQERARKRQALHHPGDRWMYDDARSARVIELDEDGNEITRIICQHGRPAPSPTKEQANAALHAEVLALLAVQYRGREKAREAILAALVARDADHDREHLSLAGSRAAAVHRAAA